MDDEEAVNDAIEQLKASGVIDLGHLVTDLTSTDPLTTHPVVAATDQLCNALRADEPSAADVLAGVVSINDITDGEEDVKKVAIKMSPEALKRVIELLSADTDSVLPALKFFTTVYPALDAFKKAAFASVGGQSSLKGITEKYLGFAVDSNEAKRLLGLEVFPEVLGAVLCALRQSEPNKANFVSDKGLDLLQAALTIKKDAILVSTCSILRSLLTADDPNSAVSEVFDRARCLAGEKVRTNSGLVPIASEPYPLDRLLSAFEATSSDAPLAVDIANVLKCMAISNEICATISSNGMIARLSRSIQVNMGDLSENMRVVAAFLRLLKNLSSRDECKDEFFSMGDAGAERPIVVVLELLKEAMDEAAIAQICLECINSVTLRKPLHAAAVAENGGVGLISAAMVRHSGSSAVLRAACAAARCLASRNLEVRKLMSQDKRLVLLVKDAAQRPECKQSADAALMLLVD